MVAPIGLEPTTSTMSRWHSTNWVTGPKRNGSISKKSLNSKQILIFRKIPPKFYTRFRRDVKPRRNSTRNFIILPKPRAKFYPATKIRNPTRNFILLLKFRNPARNFIAFARHSRVSPQQPILLRFVLSSRFALPRLVSSARLALPCLISPACLAPPRAR